MTDKTSDMLIRRAEIVEARERFESAERGSAADWMFDSAQFVDELLTALAECEENNEHLRAALVKAEEELEARS